jgi:hypothetical protein
MLFRLVRPLKRPGSPNPYFAQRIPADLRARAVGVSLAIPLGQATVPFTITAKTECVRGAKTCAQAGAIRRNFRLVGPIESDTYR